MQLYVISGFTYDVLKQNTQQALHKECGMGRISFKTESFLSTPWWKGSRSIATIILNLRTTCKWSDAWPGRCIPSTHRTWHLLGPRPRFGHSGQQKNLLTLPWIELWFISCPAYNRLTILITISWIKTMKLKQPVFSYDIFQYFHGKTSITQLQKLHIGKSEFNWETSALQISV